MRPVTVVSYVAQLGQFRLETRTALKKTELLFKVREGAETRSSKLYSDQIHSRNFQEHATNVQIVTKLIFVINLCSPLRF